MVVMGKGVVVVRVRKVRVVVVVVGQGGINRQVLRGFRIQVKLTQILTLKQRDRKHWHNREREMQRNGDRRAEAHVREGGTHF